MSKKITKAEVKGFFHSRPLIIFMLTGFLSLLIEALRQIIFMVMNIGYLNFAEIFQIFNDLEVLRSCSLILLINSTIFLFTNICFALKRSYDNRYVLVVGLCLDLVGLLDAVFECIVKTSWVVPFIEDLYSVIIISYSYLFFPQKTNIFA